MLSREAFIEAYVRRCRSVGFSVMPTDKGCVYLATPEEDEIWMTAVPCSCEGHDEGWHMEEDQD